MKTLTIILTDGPYISEYAEMAYKIASRRSKVCSGEYISLPGCGAYSQSSGRSPLFLEMRASYSRSWPRRELWSGPVPGVLQPEATRADEDGICPDYHPGIKITSLYDLAEMLKKSDRVIAFRDEIGMRSR